MASGLIRTALPFVPYVPLNVLQPDDPPTLAMPKTTLSGVPASAAFTVDGGTRYESTSHRPRRGLFGAAS